VIKDHLQDAVELRKKHALRFPVEKVVLCEGITEEILLPEFAKFCGCDFDKQGIKLISAGGKNQVAKLYYELKNELNVPIFVLLDADAIEVSNSIKSVLRLQDTIYLIDKGEFEDIFSLNLIKRTINNSFRNICECSISDIKQEQPMVKTLTYFYRIHELGDFQKSEFARELANNLKYDTDITQEIQALINSIINI
jgi:predicted ATP-dependent endonuclease of OLD family